jgi:hypothetical protein
MFRSRLVHHRVGAIVVAPVGAHPTLVAEWVSASLGVRAETVCGIETWYEVHSRLRHTAWSNRPVPSAVDAPDHGGGVPEELFDVLFVAVLRIRYPGVPP